MVTALRTAIPVTVQRYTGCVTSIATTEHIQTIMLADGTQLEARLVVLATGLHRTLHAQLGNVTQTISAKHSVAIGFDVSLPSPPDEVIVYQGDAVNQVDYLTVFPLKRGCGPTCSATESRPVCRSL